MNFPTFKLVGLWHNFSRLSTFGFERKIACVVSLARDKIDAIDVMDHLSLPAHAMNNPSRFTDPDGHKACDEVDANGHCYTENEVSKKLSKKKDDQDKKDHLDNCLKNFGSCYDIDAIIWGAGLSGSEPGLYNTAGLEEIVMFSDLKRATFLYGGQGSSVGAGASAAAYGGVVFNLKDPDDYRGPFGSTGFTVSILAIGLTASYFWDDSRKPFSAGTTQGLAVGYAPGAQVSAWWSSTAYALTWRSDK